MKQLPLQTKWLLQQFENAGFSCFFVGGCVRDYLLGRSIHDYDFTSNATPEQMRSFLSDKNCTILDIGASFGTITVIYQGLTMEITTYRIEQKYQNHRSPKQLSFTDDINADLARRDFTINAMAYHPQIGLIDPFYGLKDLKKQLIRCVGCSHQRLNEDALRILRALRFHFTLHFTLDSECEAAIIDNAYLLTDISKERIQAEFSKILMSDAENLLKTLRHYHVLEFIVPFISEIYDITQESKWHSYDVFTHTDIALNHTSGFCLTEKLAVLFHDFGKAYCKQLDAQGNAHFPQHQTKSAELAKQALYEMKYPKRMIKDICTLIALHDDYIEADELSLIRLLAKLNMNYSLAYSLIRIQYADTCAKNLVYSQTQLQKLTQAQRKLKTMEHSGFSILPSDLALNGNDLIELGLSGKQIKEALDFLYEQVIGNPQCNQKEQLIKLLKQK